MILDIFSRYPVGWMVASRESAILAERLIANSSIDLGAELARLRAEAA